jgi:hypothetical protein
MPVVLETKNGQQIEFPKPNFLPGNTDAEMFPHFMMNGAISQSYRHSIGLQLQKFFNSIKKKFDPEMKVEVYSNEMCPPRIYSRSKYIPKRYEVPVFEDIVIVTIETMGLSYNGNSMCKGSESWAAPPLDLYGSQEKPERQLYTYGIYTDYSTTTPRTFFGPMYIPYFYDMDDPRPLTKNNVPALFIRLTNFMKREIKEQGMSCIRLQRLVTDESDIPNYEDQLILNQIAAFRKVYVENPKAHNHVFKEYVDTIEQMYKEKNRKWLEHLRKQRVNATLTTTAT